MAKSDTTEVDELAFRLYAERLAGMPAQTSGDAAAIWAYRKAEEFLQTRDKVKSGAAAEQLLESKLSPVRAPNLKPTHPHNLVAQYHAEEHGGETRVLALLKEIMTWLNQNPSDPERQVAYVNRSRGIDWDVPTTNLARTLIPYYVN